MSPSVDAAICVALSRARGGGVSYNVSRHTDAALNLRQQSSGELTQASATTNDTLSNSCPGRPSATIGNSHSVKAAANIVSGATSKRRIQDWFVEHAPQELVSVLAVTISFTYYCVE